MQLCNRIYYSKIYWRINMFRAAYRSLSGAANRICSLWFIFPCGDRPLSRLGANGIRYLIQIPDPVRTQPGQRPVTTWEYNPEAANTVWSSWWWAVCSSKHYEPSINFGIINSITKLHLVGYFYWLVIINRCRYVSLITINYQLFTTGRHIIIIIASVYRVSGNIYKYITTKTGAYSK
jgi:hypothetical protein